ncbi:Acyl transferase domain-containing protein [Solimonas aquatica]|uniref:Acyl transferase domain-containing protein n=1 Tax=Solimonas aquatica TaxID=489703 RepID=A0A1H9CW85_9GAMM|nr:type I polyketide synthase [Solimonas aquatica]SEQ05434.1 Acyl transferase domain-containing protein [Solimonas aquatica]
MGISNSEQVSPTLAATRLFGGLDPGLLALTPFEHPDLPLARALRRHRLPVVIDLGRVPEAQSALLGALARERGAAAFGLRIPEGVSLAALTPPAGVAFLLIAEAPDTLPAAWRALPLIAQVCSLEEAERAVAQGVAGLVGKGQESGGRQGAESSFVLLQRLLERFGKQLPVWCQGGIALNSAVAAMAGGATGVVLDAALAALPEATLPAEIKTQLLSMDGSEARVIAGLQVYARGQREAAQLEALDADQLRAAQARGELWAIGQDAALARLVLAECANLEALINTLRLRIPGQLRQAQSLRVLDAGNAWARSHGTQCAVAQGPMTRVTDTAEFAEAVAVGGGLPFLALSLMKADACRKLMEDTRARVGERPWGVGVLGFAAPEILDPQLALVKELKPSVLLLAGGRPSQARPFIEAGIPTYLHVPSPGLLDIFLKDGATHFVFEGRECGGHVGPRYSFVLWEQALAQLMQHSAPQQLHVLFAGGIHDERSAAMVAALAAPLAARGARIGVLAGTAYITTEEAVRCGAVLEGFQRKALAGAHTDIVETAPGHAIRCLHSGFMDLFAREKARLKDAGVDPREAAKLLEALTVGRLRIATKGVDYVDGRLAPVAEAVQEAEGMYMIGQIIALKREVIAVAELHRRLSAGASAYLDALDLPAPPAPQAEPIAVVGMACLYPGSPDLESFWANILEGRDLVREVPAERWNLAQYYGGADAPADKSVSKWGGFIDDTPFDPLQYGIPPASLAAIEPVQLLSLEITRQALKDAGYEGRWFDREKTSVIFGAEAGMDLGNQYNFRNLYGQYCGELPPALAQALPSLTEDSFPGMLVNVIAGRIANRLGLGGVNYTVTSACASSLTAIELAAKELRGGSSDMVLAGGADFHNGISDFLMFSSVGALSARGRCRSFDHEADGICLGEGVGVVVLKRLADAERDGDRIYALLDGIAGSSDGKGLGLTAPRKEGQKRALERTYWQAGALPAEIGLVEAHGTGTVVGDRTELKTLTEVFNAYGAVPGQTGLGSVKSQIGHTKCAAGVAGFIKVAKALHHRVLPPTHHVSKPNPGYERDSSPFQLNRKPLPWSSAQTRGAVSAFGFGGTNFHAVLSAYEPQRSALGAVQLPVELFAVRGASRGEALQQLSVLRDYLASSDAALALRDLAATLWRGGSGAVQLAFVAASREQLQQRLAEALQDKPANGPGSALHWRDAKAPAGKLAFLYPGQGSQYPGMLQDLFVYFPALQAALAGAQEYAPIIWPATAYDEATRAAQQQRLTDTRNTQPALGIVGYAAYQWLTGLGIRPDMAAGHSYGELVALATAGAFDAATLSALSRARAEAILGALGGGDNGAMAAVRLDAASLGPLLAGFPNVVMANQNSPVQTVISGPTADVEAACAFLGQHAVGYKRIDTDCAFHSPLMAAAEQRYAETLRAQPFAPLQYPVYSNISAAPHAADDAPALRESLARHIVSPVRFVAEIERMYADGARVFVELGPRRVLTGLVARILKDQPHSALALDGEERGLAGSFELLAQLATLLPEFNADALFEGRAATLDLSQPRKLAATTWMVNGGRAWPLKGKLPANAAAVVLQPVIAPGAPATAPTLLPAQAAQGDQALVHYLSNMRELVHAQRDVLLGYFGAPAPRATAVTPSYAPPAVAAAALPAPVAAPAAAPSAASHREVLLRIVSERTGYPVEMLDPDLDLEADLSIDSIKRMEVIGELAQALSLRSAIGAQADALLEQLSAKKTLRAMLAWLDERVPASAVPASKAAAPAAPGAVDHQAALLEIVSHSTGYPIEALDLDLDLEADLSIDSIKRVEVIGELAQRLSLRGQLGTQADVLLEQLSAQKTLRAMLGWLAERLPAAAPAARSASPAAAASTPPLREILLEIISQSTGYPPEALDLDLDLEADLSIDSIKRLEVVNQLATRLNLDGGGNKDALLDKLASLKTLRALLEALGAGSAPAPGVAAPVVTVSSEPVIPLERYVLRRQQVPPAQPSEISLAGKSFLISDDRLGVAPRVAALLAARGARASIVDFPSASALPADLDQVDGLIHLWSLNPASRVREVKRFFAVVRESLVNKARHLLVASGLGGDFGEGGAVSSYERGAGLAGLIKSVAKEFGELRAHWVDVDPREPAEVLAHYIEQELLSRDAIAEVAYQAGRRYAREAVSAELPSGSLDGLPLTPDSVVLLTGGARGITALVAVELARRYRCHVELVGRSALPEGEEDAATRGIEDPRKLRQALLAADPRRKPAEIEKLARRIVADREVRATLSRVKAAGSSLHYTQLDVREARPFAQFIDEVYARRGRIDGVIHGAGVVEDKLVRDKTVDSFVRVFDTKVRGAMVLSRRIHDDVKFVVFFSSVASAFGNRGQVDYASANDVLDKLAHAWQQRIKGRVLSVNWGPWADTGMVSESLKNEYLRKGIGLIPQQQGVQALLRELAQASGDSQVVFMCGKPASFGALPIAA